MMFRCWRHFERVRWELRVLSPEVVASNREYGKIDVVYDIVVSMIELHTAGEP